MQRCMPKNSKKRDAFLVLFFVVLRIVFYFVSTWIRKKSRILASWKYQIKRMIDMAIVPKIGI